MIMTKCIYYRTTIPEKIKMLLAYKSGGRCGICNHLLYKDKLTLTLGNFADRAHIIPVKSAWARGGNSKKSKDLEVSEKNILLLCKLHHKIIDDNPDDWPAEKLIAIKKEHEKRIEIVTAINEAKTHVLIIQSNIGGNTVEVNKQEVLEAVISNRMYPSEEEPFVIDLTGDVGSGDRSFYESKAREIDHRIKAFLDKANASSSRPHISIFPLALMPLLVYLGKELGDKHSISLFQHHRTPSSWVWDNTPSYQDFIIKRPEKKFSDKNVYLKIALSDYIGQDKLGSLGHITSNIYEITVQNPTTRFLVNKDQLQKFDEVYRLVLNEIQHEYGKDCIIHLLLAAPCPIAVQCGISLLTRKDPKVKVYDYDSKSDGFTPVLTIG